MLKISHVNSSNINFGRNFNDNAVNYTQQVVTADSFERNSQREMDYYTKFVNKTTPSQFLRIVINDTRGSVNQPSMLYAIAKNVDNDLKMRYRRESKFIFTADHKKHQIEVFKYAYKSQPDLAEFIQIRDSLKTSDNEQIMLPTVRKLCNGNHTNTTKFDCLSYFMSSYSNDRKLNYKTIRTNLNLMSLSLKERLQEFKLTHNAANLDQAAMDSYLVISRFCNKKNAGKNYEHVRPLAIQGFEFARLPVEQKVTTLSRLADELHKHYKNYSMKSLYRELAKSLPV